MIDHPFNIHEGQRVYLIPSMTTIRRTKGGLWLCNLNGKEVSIPESMIRNKPADDYILYGKLPTDKAL